MLTYVTRQEVVPALSIDPVLHYYPLMACYQEPQAPATIWRDHTGGLGGVLLPCDPPGRAWMVAASDQAAAALMEEVPPDMAVSFPLWAEHAVSQVAPQRKFSTDAL